MKEQKDKKEEQQLAGRAPEPPHPPADKQKNALSQPPAPDKAEKKPSKVAVFGRLFKDLGKFIFSDGSAAEELEKDIATIEKHRSKEKMMEEARKAKEKEEAEKAKAAAEKAKRLKEQEKLKQESFSKTEKLAKQRHLKIKQKSKEQQKYDKLKQKRAKRLAKEKAELTADLKSEKDKAAKHGARPQQTKTAAPVPPPKPETVANDPKAPLPPKPKPVLKPAQKRADRRSDKEEHKVKPEDDKDKAAYKFKKQREQLSENAAKENIEKREWKSYKMVSANLIKQQASLFFNWKGRILALVIFVIIAVIVNLLIYVGLMAYEQEKLSDSQDIFDNLNTINALINEKDQFVSENVMPLSDKLSFVNYMLSNHIYWTQFFTLLEDNTTTNVYYKSFAGDIDGEYTLPSVAVDFAAVNEQIAVLDHDPKVISVNSPGGKLTDSGPDTQSSIKLDEEIPGQQEDENAEKIEENQYGFATFDLKLKVNKNIFLR